VLKPLALHVDLCGATPGLTWRFSRGRVGGFFGAVPFYRNRFPPSSPNALCASALALRAPYDAQSVVNAQRYLPYTSRNKFRPLSGSIPERRRLVPDLDRRSQARESLNDGSSRAVCVKTRKGSFVDPKPPAAVAACTTLTASVIIEAVMDAMAEAVPHRVVCGFARRFRVAISGTDRAGRSFIWHSFANRGGAGAHQGGDGWSNIGVVHNPGGAPSPSVERTESAYPFVVEAYSLRPDSAGTGQFRGGLGGVYAIRYEGTTPARITPTGDGEVIAPYGLRGGQPGAVHYYTIEQGGNTATLGSKDANATLMPGAVLTLRSAGGGGFGDPKLREPSLVKQDLDYGYVTG